MPSSIPRYDPSRATGDLIGTPSFGYTGAYGGVPGVPNPVTTAGTATAGNLGNLPGIQNLAGGVNQFNTAQQLQQLQSLIPDYGGLSQQSSQNILQQLSGQVPSDVVNQIMQNAAERGIVTGGGQNANAAYLRALGLTSLGMQQQGEQNLTATMNRTPRPPLFDPSRMFVSPGEQQEAQFGANVFGGAPVPSQAAEEARRNARAGMSFGAGSVPRAPTYSMPNLGMGGGYTPSGGWGNTATDMNYTLGGPNAYANWQAMYGGGGAPGAGGTGGIDDYLYNMWGPGTTSAGGGGGIDDYLYNMWEEGTTPGRPAGGTSYIAPPYGPIQDMPPAGMMTSSGMTPDMLANPYGAITNEPPAGMMTSPYDPYGQ